MLFRSIVTDSSGLVAGEVSVAVADGKIPAYRAMPAAPGKYPVLLVVQEIFGVHEHIKDMCRRFAKLGYYAIAPELYARQGDVSKMTDIGAILSTVVAKVPSITHEIPTRCPRITWRLSADRVANLKYSDPW